MPSGKLKTIILMILIAANVALGGLFVFRQSRALHARQDTLEKSVAVLSEGGIRINCTLPSDIGLSPVYTTRDTEAEAAFMAYFLGTVEVSDLGGRANFSGTRGTGFVRQNGVFEITFSNWETPITDAFSITSMLTNAGLSVTAVSGEDSDVYTFQQLLNGVPVRHCDITVIVRNGVLRSVYGQFISPSRQTGSFDGPLLDTATLLLRFYAGIRDGGYICSVINDVSPWYQETEAENGYMPCWRFETDTGVYFVDPVSGFLSV